MPELRRRSRCGRWLCGNDCARVKRLAINNTEAILGALAHDGQVSKSTRIFRVHVDSVEAALDEVSNDYFPRRFACLSVDRIAEEEPRAATRIVSCVLKGRVNDSGVPCERIRHAIDVASAIEVDQHRADMNQVLFLLVVALEQSGGGSAELRLVRSH